MQKYPIYFTPTGVGRCKGYTIYRFGRAGRFTYQIEGRKGHWDDELYVREEIDHLSKYYREKKIG